MKISTLTYFLLCTLLISCGDDEDSEPTPFQSSTSEAIIECHEDMRWESTELASALHGEWAWSQQFNPWQGIVDTTTFAQGRLTLDPDGTYSWTHNGDTNEGSWSVSANLSTFCPYILDIDIPSARFKGCVFLCDDEFIIYASPLDGLDVWFYRVD